MYWVTERGQTVFERVVIDASSAPPVAKPEELFTEPRFAETPGWSHAFMPNGDVVFVQSPSENLGYYVRVVPNWVREMKRAVDAANK